MIPQQSLLTLSVPFTQGEFASLSTQTIHWVLPVLQALFSVALFWVVARQDRRSPAHRLFLVFLVAMALWGASVSGMRLSRNLGHALWWERATLVMIAFTTVSFFLFVRRYTGLGRWFGGYIALGFLLVTVAIAPTSLLASGMRVDRYGNAPVTGLLFPLWVLENYAIVINAIYRLEQGRRLSTTYEAKNRYIYFIMGLAICLMGAGTDAVSAFGVPIYPLAIPSNIAFACITSIAIARYHLLDIRLTFRKGLVYFLTSTLIAVPLVSIPAASYWLLRTLGLSEWWLAVPLLGVALLLDPVWRRAQRALERRFYGEKYDYLRALERFDEQSKGITDMNELGSLIVNMADRVLQPGSVWLLIASADGSFSVTAAICKEHPASARLGASHPITLWLKRRPVPVWQQEIDVFPLLQAMTVDERHALDSLKAQLYSPIMAEKQLIGILALGPKRSGGVYSGEDMRLLSTLSRQAALNLENVRLLKLERERAFHLEKLEQMKTDFLLAISHQLKTPLTSIKVASGILSESAGKVPDELRGRLVGEIGYGVEELETQIGTILDHAKMQSATLELFRRPTDMKELIEEAAHMVGPQMRLKQQTLQLALSDSIPTAMIDGQRIKQVLANLLSNANKFTPKGGLISVRLWQADANLCVEVKDTGPGIPAEEREKVFEAYYQVRNGVTQSSSGTGLGLTIAKALVDLHGGRIWVEGKAGEGAAFVFTLPLTAGKK